MGGTEAPAEELVVADLVNSSPLAPGGAVEDTAAEAEAPGTAIASKSTTTPVFSKRPMLLQEKFSTPPVGKSGTPPLPRASPVLAERNRELAARRPNALQLPPKNFVRHQERYMSPTDAMVSPISKGLLLRSKRPVRTAALLAPPKALEATFESENLPSVLKS